MSSMWTKPRHKALRTGEKKNMVVCYLIFCVEILQAVCLGFVNIPDIGPIPLKIIVQQLVQHCETHIEAQSCKASYVNIFVLSEGQGNTMPPENIYNFTFLCFSLFFFRVPFSFGPKKCIL